MTFEEFADQYINTNQSAYTAAKAGWDAAIREAVSKLEQLAKEENTIEYTWAAKEIRPLRSH